jgi:hypothetical protein
MREELKTAGFVALVGAAIGGGLALGMGLRAFTAFAVVGLGAGLALGVSSGLKASADRVVRDAPLSQLS